MLNLSAASRSRLARRDARLEHREPLRFAVPDRAPGRLLIECNGQRFDLDLRPDRRDCRRWYAFRESKPFTHGGLEQIWREVQRQITPVISARRLD